MTDVLGKAIDATPVPVTPPVVPPRPPLWVVIEPPTHFNKYRKAWSWTGMPESFDNEDDAQDCASEHPGSVIFRLPGSGETT